MFSMTVTMSIPLLDEAVPVAFLERRPMVAVSAPVSCHLRRGGEKLRQSLEVQHPADQVSLLPNLRQSTPAEPPQTMPLLAFAEQLLDLLPAALRHLIGLPTHPHPNPHVG